MRGVRNPMPAVAAFALLVAVFPGARAAQAWDVEPGSSGNRITLELYNLETDVDLAGLAVEVLAAPSWLHALEVEGFPAAPVLPGEKMDVVLHFDVADGLPAGARDRIEIAISSSAGDEWRQSVPLALVEEAAHIQTDCCTDLQIGTATDVAGDAIPGDGWPGTDRGLFVTSFPNPSRPSATIRFALSEASDVRVTVHDVTGRLVRTLLAEERRDAGAHEFRWDGRDDTGERAGSGLYFVRVQIGDEMHTAKVVLAR